MISMQAQPGLSEATTIRLVSENNDKMFRDLVRPYRSRATRRSTGVSFVGTALMNSGSVSVKVRLAKQPRIRSVSQYVVNWRKPVGIDDTDPEPHVRPRRGQSSTPLLGGILRAGPVLAYKLPLHNPNGGSAPLRGRAKSRWELE
jgi:hypothetical protein